MSVGGHFYRGFKVGTDVGTLKVRVQELQGSRADGLPLLVRFGGWGGEAQRVVEGPGKRIKFTKIQGAPGLYVCVCVSATALQTILV